MELGALDQLLLHTGTLGSIYHKTPEASLIRHTTGCSLTPNRLSYALQRAGPSRTRPR
jgi:hypothetical protein